MKKIIIQVILLIFALAPNVLAQQDTSTTTNTEQGQSQHSEIIYSPQSESVIFPANAAPQLLSPTGGYHFPRNQFTGNIWNPKMFNKKSFTRHNLEVIAGQEKYILYPNPEEITSDSIPSKNITIYVMEQMAPGNYCPLWSSFTGFNHQNIPSPGLIAAMAIGAMDKGANVLEIIFYGGDREFQAKSMGASGSGMASFIANGAKDVATALGGIAGITQITSKHPDKAFIHAIPYFYTPLNNEELQQARMMGWQQANAQKVMECNLLRQNPLYVNNLAIFGCK